MISTLYRCLTELGAPVIDLYLKRRLARGREDAERFSERLGQASLSRPAGFLIWCHAASVGEAASLLALINKILERCPGITILMTTGTVTSARMLKDRLPPGAIHQYIPVDRLPYVRSFLDHWHPDLVLWVESELWPNILDEVRKREIPAALVNGRMSEKSFYQWYRVRSWAKHILSTFAICLTQTEAERGRFVTLGAKPVRCIGNLKYAAEPLPHNYLELDHLKDVIGERPIWLMASTHRGEEDVAATAHFFIKNTKPNVLTIIAPRHAVRGDEIENKLRGLGLNIARRSKRDEITPETEIYLADTMGELGLFYRLAPITAMGGSFASIGGHNPIEPAQLNSALILGPAMFNFSTVVREFTLSRAAVQIPHGNELGFTVLRLMDNEGERGMLTRNAQGLAQEKARVLDDILKELEPWLPRRSSLELRSGT